MDLKKEGRKMLALPRFNIRDTKKHYSEVSNIALKGLEVISFNATMDNEEVSLIKTTLLDTILDHLNFNPSTEFDEELGIYTVALHEIDLYGEGKTVEEAVEDLVNSILDFLAIYIEKIDLFSKVEPDLKKAYLLKLLRCNGDTAKIRKAIGIDNAD
jgi:hypothetical protein